MIESDEYMIDYFLYFNIFLFLMIDHFNIFFWCRASSTLSESHELRHVV